MKTQEIRDPRKWTFLFFYKGYFPFRSRLLELALPVPVSVFYKPHQATWYGNTTFSVSTHDFFSIWKNKLEQGQGEGGYFCYL